MEHVGKSEGHRGSEVNGSDDKREDCSNQQVANSNGGKEGLLSDELGRICCSLNFVGRIQIGVSAFRREDHVKTWGDSGQHYRATNNNRVTQARIKSHEGVSLRHEAHEVPRKEGQDPERIIEWLVKMGWEYDPDKAARLRKIVLSKSFNEARND